MTTPSTTRKAGPFTGTGSQSSWPFTFKVFAAADVKVTVADTTGAESVLALGSDYAVALNENQETSPGGTVTYLLADEYKLTITGDLDYDQSYDIPAGGNFNPVALENQLDRMVMQTQQLAEEMGRAVKVPVTDDATGQLSTDLANGILALSPIVGDIQTVAGSATEVENVSVHMTAVSAVGSNITNINTVAGISSNVTSVAGNATNINAVAAKATQIAQVAAVDDEVAAVAGNATNINTVAGMSANISTVAGNTANINAVAGNATNIATVAGISTNVTSVAGNTANINAAVSNAANINAAVSNATNINTVAGISANVSTVATNIAAVNTNATNIVAIQSAAANAASAASSAATAAAYVGNIIQNPILGDDVFNGNGSTTAFTLSRDMGTGNATALLVTVSGITQAPSAAYSVTGTTLTFTSAPPSGTGNIRVRYIGALAVDTAAALTAATNASASASAASTSASAAAASATTAANNATSAGTSAASASTSAANASTHSASALSSATNAANSATSAANSATSAGASATAAAGYLAPVTSTSTTSVAIGTGSKSFTVETGKPWVAGMPINIAVTASPSTNYMTGSVVSYNSGTGALVVDVTAVAGSGTYTAWSLSLKSGASSGGGSSTRAFGMPVAYLSGKYYLQNGALGSSNWTPSGWPSIYYFPIFVETTITVDRLAAAVSATSTASFELAIYDTVGGKPSSRLATSGTISAAAAGTKTATISATLTPGVYWLAFGFSTGTLSMDGVYGLLSLVSGGDANFIGTFASLYYSHNFGSTTLPLPASASTYTLSPGGGNNETSPRVHFRVQ